MSILGRHSLFGVAVLAATGVPYSLSAIGDKSAPESETSWQSAADADSGDAAVAGNGGAPDMVTTTNRFSALQSTERPLEGPGASSLAEVLRFDVSPAWLLGRWPRVMNSRFGELHAYRVPLVTGITDGDLAGSLTYYFNPRQQVQQIRFQGSTGDARPLVAYVGQNFGFLHQQTNDPSEYLYQVKRHGRAVSELRVKIVPLVEASASTMRFQVDLAMERPSDHRLFSESTSQVDGFRWP